MQRPSTQRNSSLGHGDACALLYAYASNRSVLLSALLSTDSMASCCCWLSRAAFCNTNCWIDELCFHLCSSGINCCLYINYIHGSHFYYSTIVIIQTFILEFFLKTNWSDPDKRRIKYRVSNKIFK